jgi:hypothetical protein
MSEFYRTGMGHKFYEGTMPQLVVELRRLNDNIEKLLEVVQAVRLSAVITEATKDKDQ